VSKDTAYLNEAPLWWNLNLDRKWQTKPEMSTNTLAYLSKISKARMSVSKNRA
jgi:hypothetical protein